MAAKIKKGDRVIVTSGRDKGKRGEVLRVFPDEARVVVVRREHGQAPHSARPQRTQGGIISKEAPVHLSKIAHIDPKTGKPTRVGFKVLKDGRKVRFAKKSGEVIDV